MKNAFQRGVAGLLGIALVLCLTIPAASAQKKRSTAPAQAGNTKRMNDAVRHSRAAAKVFDEIMAVPDKAIPKE